ncbi:MAG: 3'-5' exoribonuclease YhaM family protein [Christensenellales bacterium]
MTQALSQLKKGDRFEGLLLVKQAEVRVSQNGSRFLDVTLCDKTGEMNGKSWEWQHEAPKAMSVVNVRAVTNEFMGKLQLKVDSIVKTDVSKVNLASLIPCAPELPDEYMSQILTVIDEMQDDDIKLLCAAAVDMNKERLRYWPAAMSFHHSERTGLLHHMTSMIKAAKALLSVYTFLDADLLLGGVILHDICKLQELEAGELGLASEYSRKGLLIGHISLGTSYVLKLAEELDIDEETGLLLAHMVLSHHSEPDYGSPRRPMFAEAEMLHYIDKMDARMYDFKSNISAIDKGGFTGYIRSLENRKLYRHKKFKTEEDIEQDVEKDIEK